MSFRKDSSVLTVTRTDRTAGSISRRVQGFVNKRKNIDVSFSRVCSVIDNEYRHCQTNGLSAATRHWLVTRQTHETRGGVLPYMGCIGMCGPKGYGFSAFLVINRVSILAGFGYFGHK